MPESNGRLNGWLRPGLVLTLLVTVFGAGAWVGGADVRSAFSGDALEKLDMHIARGGHPGLSLQIAVMDERQRVLQRDVREIRALVEQIRDSLREGPR